MPISRTALARAAPLRKLPLLHSDQTKENRALSYKKSLSLNTGKRYPETEEEKQKLKLPWAGCPEPAGLIENRSVFRTCSPILTAKLNDGWN